ncbi:hypothetical protein AVEN_176688-1 [Araneus ventricosus]|uniref:Uncharacterized protein n=1 Tax=Araneus ventricosus TaxID=182803 RepID=A0A4Y2NIU0_ARAVE|nr:hypothetical protein AVEN_176688-1 [Araneus ventricosus]
MTVQNDQVLSRCPQCLPETRRIHKLKRPPPLASWAEQLHSPERKQSTQDLFLDIPEEKESRIVNILQFGMESVR